ncbi:translocation/assembly module TamB domain-containing protein [Erythrobacter sp. JK5]|uniref:translocation/assembly module TamB domain-containing protein n=1 Tax=Erythrobacter sp. JK5 TaxID=2829500 RepID=UPI001BA7F742|nr:translocation/assembly module TamB domain-containing protein [Erythrobacter sp. JK5]QUL36574.1 translocation/assembly module TamB domain-containing protein [Erythrobacter sp. JK5]
MASEADTAPQAGADPSRRRRVWAKRLGWALALVLLPIVLVAGFLSSPIGKRFVADQIAQVAPASGLRFEVGRIEGDIYGTAVLYDVILRDPKGEFLTIPEVALDWRPLAWLWSGLDIRELSVRRGRLSRLPELLPGDPDAPLLPDFDIRVDRLAIEDLTIASGVATEGAQRVNLGARIDIRSGRALIEADGELGSRDTVSLLLDAEPDGDRFDLALDYNAPAGGVIAGLTGLDMGYRAQIEGDGTWSRWLGHALVTRYAPGTRSINGERVAGFRLTNRAGTYGLLGQVSPRIDQDGLTRRAVGDALSLVAQGTLEESVFEGQLVAISDTLAARGRGAIDLAGNRFDAFETVLRLRDPDLLGGGIALANARIEAELDGLFRDLTIPHRLTTSQLAIGTITVDDLSQRGTATFREGVLTLPLDAETSRVSTGVELVDAQLERGTLDGTLNLADGKLTVDGARVSFPGLDARLTLRGDTGTGVYAVAGPIEARGLALEGIGRATGNAKLLAKFGSDIPWTLRANVAGRLSDVTNATVANVAGQQLRFRGAFGMGGDQPIVLRDVSLDSERLQATLDSQIRGEVTTLAGRGRHSEYGPFTIDATIEGSGPRAVLVLADPLPAAGLSDVRIAIAPSDDGFALDVAGGSLLGPFEGALGLVLPSDAPTRIDIARLDVFRTSVSGALTLGEAGISGDLALAGGGLDGRLALAPSSAGAQGFELTATARNARFEGPTPLSLAKADIFARGRFGSGRSQVFADIDGTGLDYGSLSIASFAAKAAIEDGRGSVLGSIAGRRSDRFALKFDGDIAPERIALLARGEFAGRSITMPRRAVLTPLEAGGYRLAPTQIGFARGFAIFEGTLGGPTTAIEARIAEMPLRLADLAVSDLGFGGRLSGIVTYRQAGDGPPTGSARLKIDDFSRAGILLSSRPIDVLTVVDLGPDRLTAGARLAEDGRRLGRLDARITGLGGGSDLAGRIMRGRLNATLAYDGNAEALWRLSGVDTFDLTGPLAVTANATGTLNNPRLGGTLASENLRLQSAITGTDISAITARGRFAGSRLQLTRFAGTPRGGGSVSGSGTIDLSQMSAERGPQLDIRVAARNAKILDTAGLDTTVTGPLRIVSNGAGGTIAGRVQVNSAFWQLGTAAEDMSLPQIATREVNRTDGGAATVRSGRASPWRYLVDARARRRIEVDGLGLDSEWAADIQLRGTVDDPRLGGEARLVRGAYSFAGARFELTRGRIRFNLNEPIDPQLDIAAETNRNGADVTVTITGRSQAPRIALSSEPPLPEEEILAQLLFGSSVTSLAATDAVQLAAALAALQGGSGLDPIGQLRRSIGLDQLRIVSADPALGRSTGVALGKYLGNKVYIELVTDGQGYSATRLEYRVTRWLALLGTVSTIGRDSVAAEISRDY